MILRAAALWTHKKGNKQNKYAQIKDKNKYGKSLTFGEPGWRVYEEGATPDTVL